jgi:hypothetical protein
MGGPERISLTVSVLNVGAGLYDPAHVCRIRAARHG